MPVTRLPQSVHVFLDRINNGKISYLLFKRNTPPELALPAFWQGISGALAPGEGYKAAAVRKVTDEAQLHVDRIVDSVFSHCYPIKDEWRTAYEEGSTEVEERVFYALLADDAVPVLSHEHQEWGWFSQGEEASLLTFGRTRDCLLAVDQALSHRAEMASGTKLIN